jgi:hypothetical protein
VYVYHTVFTKEKIMRTFFVDFNLNTNDKSISTVYVKASDEFKALKVIIDTYKESVNQKVYEVDDDPIDCGWYTENGEFVPPTYP